MTGKGRRVMQTLSFEFIDDVCDSESTRRAPEFPALNHHHYRRQASSAIAPQRKATRQPTIERPRTRAQVQRRGPASPHMNTRESSELSTPPREEPEPEPNQAQMDTGDSPTGELQDSRQQSESETGAEVRMRSVQGVTGRCRSCPPLIGKRGIALTLVYGGQRQGASCFLDSQ
jgi:hypothetical protein